MARRRQDADEDTIMESDDTAGAPTFGGDSIRGTRKVTPPSMPADLLAALAMSTTFDTRLFEITALPGTKDYWREFRNLHLDSFEGFPQAALDHLPSKMLNSLTCTDSLADLFKKKGGLFAP
jgi:hypothetical protein